MWWTRCIDSFFPSEIGVAEEPLSAVTGTPAPAAAIGGDRTCEYCGSHLTAGGEVLRMSDRARQLRTLEDRLERETTAHTATKAELTAAAARIAELQTELERRSAPPAGGDFLSVR
jgi:hypothetical protein